MDTAQIKQSRRYSWLVLVAGAIVLGGIVYFAWTHERSASSSRQIRVEIGSFSTAADYAPYLVARSKGWFDQALAKVGAVPDYTTFQDLPTINEAFATSKADVVFEAETPAIIGRAAGIDIRISEMSSILTQNIVVPINSAIHNVKELKGKTIAVLAGTSSYFDLFQVLKQAGLQPTDVNIVNMTPPDAKNAFETGKIDAWAVWPPWVQEETVGEKGNILQGSDAQIYSIMAVRGQFADQHPEIQRALADVLTQSKTWIVAHPVDAESIISNELGLPLNVIVAAWPTLDWNATITPAVTANIQSEVDFLYKSGSIQKKIDVTHGLISTTATQ